MPRAEMISETEFERVYEISDGRLITLKFDEDNYQITFWNEKEERLGFDEDFIFFQSEANHNKYLLARMYVPIKNQGLGRAAIELFKDVTGGVIYTRPNDGVRQDDGSHLTEDAPGFVFRMQQEGLIE